MSFSLNTLLQQCRNLTGDLSISPVFSDDQLTDYINRAIEDLSQHFPRRITYTFSTTAGQHEYDLPLASLSVLSLEFPVNQTPPVFLERRSYLDPDFFLSDSCYDFIPTSDSTSTNPPRVILSINPSGVISAEAELSSDHGVLTTGSDTTTVLNRHIHLIGLFVRWKCLQELSSSEAMDPDPLHMLSMTQELNAKRAEAAYRDALNAAKDAYGESTRSPWSMDKYEGSY